MPRRLFDCLIVGVATISLIFSGAFLIATLRGEMTAAAHATENVDDLPLRPIQQPRPSVLSRDSREMSATGMSSLCVANESKAKLEAATRQLDAATKKIRDREKEYYELLKVFADVMDQVDRNYVKKVNRRDLMRAAIRGVLSELDPYSNYIPPEKYGAFQSDVESQFGGIGIQVMIEDDHLKIISPLIGSPAYRAALMAGDYIVTIEGKPTKNLTLDEAIRRLKGKLGSTVTFTVIQPHTKKRLTVTLTREIVHVQTVLGFHRKKDDSWNFLYDPKNKLGYIRISAFSRNTAKELRSALKELTDAGMRGLVLDLRFDPGGLLTSAIEISDLFVSSGRIVSIKGRNSPEQKWDAHKKGTYDGFPMVVLVNHYSASASEILAACLQDHKRAVVIGERTWGKGSVQNIIKLEKGRSALKLTTAGYWRPSGKNIHRFSGASDDDVWGVTPNKGFVVKLTPEEKLALIDHQREIAIIPIGHAPKAKVGTKKGGAALEKQAAGKPNETEPKKNKQEATKLDASKSAPKKASPEKAEETKAKFVDKQLDKAMEYLRKQLKAE